MVILGIDLGTQNICVATPKIHSFGIVLNREAKRTNEGILGYTEQDGRLFGSFARSRMRRNIKNTLYELIRLIGRKWTDESLRMDSMWWGFKLVKNPQSEEAIAVEVDHNNKRYILGPEQILAAYISYLRDLAISDLKTKDVRDCCVAVPSYFTHEQRQMVANACHFARMNLLNIVNSSTAVALMYGLNPMDDGVKSRYVMFVDIGYANTQVGVAQFTKEKNTMHMICHTSESNAGGRNIDREMVKYFVNKINKEYGTDILNEANPNWKVINRLLLACSKLKKKLGLNNEASVVIDCLLQGDDYTISLDREQLRELIEPIIIRMMTPIKAALFQLKTRLSAKSNEVKFQCVELIGGGLRVPMIKRAIEEMIELAKKEIPHMENCIVRKTLNGDECVAKGTAYLATMLSKSYKVRRVNFYDITNFDIHVVSGAEPKELIPVDKEEVPLIDIISRPIWRRGSKIPSTRILELDMKLAEQLIRTPSSPNNYVLISQNEAENLSFGANTWLCKLHIAWQEIANHKYSEILKEHLRARSNGISQESPIILMARMGSGDFLGQFEAYCPILTSDLDAFDMKTKEADSVSKPQESKDSEHVDDEKKNAENMDTDEQESTATPNQKMETETDEEKAKEKDAKKKDVNKKKKIALRVTAEFFTKNMTPPKEAIEIETAMKKLDDDIANIQNTRNFLETSIYQVRDKLNDQYISVVEPSKLEGLKETITNMMYKLEDEEEVSRDVVVYTKDIEIIKSMTRPLDKLLMEHKTRPEAVAVLTQKINEYLTKAEKAAYMDDEKKKKVFDKCNNIQAWLKEKLTEQENLPMWSNVAVAATVIKHKLNELNGYCKPLCKEPTPAPPQPAEEKFEVPLREDINNDAASKNDVNMETDEPVKSSTKAYTGDMATEATSG